MGQDWTEKYRPASLSDVLGNAKAVTAMQRWAGEWQFGLPVERAIILAGSPGIGKTSAAIALANDMGWGLIELNASDVRSGDKIRTIATRGALFETFTDTGEYVRSKDGGKKLIILDEADNLYERVKGGGGKDAGGNDLSDRGGKAAITDTIKQTMQPIILIVNDLYALTKNSTLKRLCEVIKFQKVKATTIEKALARIIRNEGLEVEREALEILAQRADGDLRAAINDLQALSRMDTRITEKMASGMGFRDNVITLQDALQKIFKGTTTDVRKVAWELDETPDSLLTWLDENLPHEYKDPGDLLRGYEALSQADVHLGRVRKRQYYRLWAYANDAMTAGVALAKHREYHHYIRYRFPGWILKMSHTRGIRARRKELARKVGTMCHTSIKDARLELLPVIQTLFKRSEDTGFDFAVTMTTRLSLTPEETAYLLGTVTDDERVATIQEMAIEQHRVATGFFPSQLKTKKATLAGFDVKKKKVRKEKGKKEKAKKETKGATQEKAAKKEAPKGNVEGATGETETASRPMTPDPATQKRRVSVESLMGLTPPETPSPTGPVTTEKKKKKPEKGSEPRTEKAWF
jgi:replication factor C large subunit